MEEYQLAWEADEAAPSSIVSAVLTFSNGWKPGEFRLIEVPSIEAAVAMLADVRWCWVPDESSDLALVADSEFLFDQLDEGTPAWLIEPTSGDMVHIRPIATGGR